MFIAETYSAFFGELDGIVNKVGYYLATSGSCLSG